MIFPFLPSFHCACVCARARAGTCGLLGLWRIEDNLDGSVLSHPGDSLSRIQGVKNELGARLVPLSPSNPVVSAHTGPCLTFYVDSVI